MLATDHAALRRGVLATSLLDDIPLEPLPTGVSLGQSWHDRRTWRSATWPELAQALGGAEPVSALGRLRLRDWLRTRAIADLSAARPQAVLLALPRGHALHPGPSWVVDSVLGGVLDLGLGLRPTEANAATATRLAVPIPTTAAEIDLADWWPSVLDHRNAMAALTVERLHRDGHGLLRPIGGCDVLTLLSSATLRCYLAAEDGTGMRAVAVPMRERGWTDVRRIDPAFVGAAATATEPEHRAVAQPLLVTADEVSQTTNTIDLSDQARSALIDPVRTAGQLSRSVLYR